MKINNIYATQKEVYIFYRDNPTELKIEIFNSVGLSR